MCEGIHAKMRERERKGPISTLEWKICGLRGTMAGERNEVIGNEKEDGRPRGDHQETVLQETGEKGGELTVSSVIKNHNRVSPGLVP